MGICASNPEIISEEEDEKKKITTRQRRKLSLQPNKVGDIDTGFNRKASEPTNDEKAQMKEVIDEQAKGKLVDASASRQGYVPYNRGKVNQDRALVAYGLNNDPTLSLFGVMDGHGEYGHLVADFVMKNLRTYLEAEKNLKEEPAECIKRSVDNLVDALNKTRINIQFSGTTCVFGLLINRTLHVANIGDSRAIMARRNASGEITTIELSHDQKPDVQSEKDRILKAGGRIQPLPGLEGEDCGPLRVWLAKVNVPGLAMSRSIGDVVCKDVGVLHEPEVLTHQVQDNDLFAIWASDGVWEFLSNKEAINIVWAHRKNLQKACNKLIEESANQWKMHEDVIDDITCVVVQFNSFD